MFERTVRYCANMMEWATTERDYEHWKRELELAREREAETA